MEAFGSCGSWNGGKEKQRKVHVVVKTQDYGLFADFLTFLAIFLAINTPDRGQNMRRHTPIRFLSLAGKRSKLSSAPEKSLSLKESSSAEALVSSRWF